MPGYTPLIVLRVPQNVEICLDASGKLCSANAASTARFCSYHSQVDANGTEVAYVVQPWTVNTECDEPNLPGLGIDPTPQEVAIYDGSRLVGPLSQAQIAAIVNPYLNGWFAEDGSEIEDNYGCVREGVPADAAAVGGSSQNPYFLAPEFNNAGIIDTDPATPACANNVTLAPKFVVPSSVEPGDVVQFDGSVTNSTLIVPKADYQWDFGDGTTAIGPSVQHSYASGGTYTVKLTVTDRGGTAASLSQTITILGKNGHPVTPPPTTTTPKNTALSAHILLLPQGLRSLLRNGVFVRVTSNEAADGFVTVSISRSAARRAHIKTGRASTVVVGRGTVSGVASGTADVHVRLSRSMAKKLGHLKYVTVTVRLALDAAGGDHVAVDAAGRY
jgi:PKD repeat protein